MNERYLLYAVAVTILTTIISWVAMLDSSSNNGHGNGGNGRGSSWSSSSGSSGGGSGGGHK